VLGGAAGIFVAHFADQLCRALARERHGFAEFPQRIQIDRLLETTVRRNASDLHLAVGRPPTLRMGGHLRELQTKVLEPEDTMALMKAITPERIQQEFEEEGSGDFGFAYGEEARFRVAIFMQKCVASLVLEPATAGPATLLYGYLLRTDEHKGCGPFRFNLTSV
jgi:hypothetical protein